ncbi:MAG: hypothetical protein II063_10495 [Prevotella sp.]|nr:hypothetical protein [Prevotella sp.]
MVLSRQAFQGLLDELVALNDLGYTEEYKQKMREKFKKNLEKEGIREVSMDLIDTIEALKKKPTKIAVETAIFYLNKLKIA